MGDLADQEVDRILFGAFDKAEREERHKRWLEEQKRKALELKAKRQPKKAT